MTPLHVTSAEHAIWRLIAEGNTNKEMGVRLKISLKTVDKHRTRLYAKIGARCQADATRKAVEYGVITIPVSGKLVVSAPTRFSGRPGPRYPVCWLSVGSPARP